MSSQQMVDLNPPVRCVVPIQDMAGEDSEDTNRLQLMAADAKAYLRSFAWCQSIEKQYFGAGIGGVIAVFLFHLRPTRPEIDKWLWVVVGDLPPAYLVTEDSSTPSAAVATYIREMKRWIDLARSNRASPDIIPVNMEPTPEGARQLSSRLQFLEGVVLQRFREEEIERA